MVASAITTIIDGDGHVMEDQAAIGRYVPQAFEVMLRRPGIFPPLDHLHMATGRNPTGAFANVGPDGWVAFMQELGFGASVLYPTAGLAYGRIVNRDWALAATRAYNDWLFHTYLQASPRFKGMALIPLQEPDAAVEELRYAVNELGMCGAILPATGLSEPLGAKRFWPVYAEAERLGCCLAVHGGAHSGLGLDYLNVHAGVHGLGHPFGIVISFASILLNGIFDRFPGVRVGFLEAGVAWLFMAMERLQGSYASHITDDPRGELFRLRSGQRLSDYIVGYIAEGRIYLGIEGDEPLLAHAVKTVGNAPFLFSSDFPHEVNSSTCKEEIEELLQNEALSAADKGAILHGNAERFYRITAVE
jgi:predicted TIM-barrel fold metal-dependent hydrolase